MGTSIFSRRMDLGSIFSQGRKVSTTAERRLDYVCESCGFTGIARIFSRGESAEHSYTDDVHLEAQAYAEAAVQGDELLPMRGCPQCGKRNAKAVNSFVRATLAKVAGVVLFSVAIWFLKFRNESAGPVEHGIYVCAIAALGVTTFYTRWRKLKDVDKSVTFLSVTEMEIEAEQHAKNVAAREAARQARARQAKVPAKKRSRFS